MAKRRASGEGSVSKRADGRWEGRIIIGRKENGRPIYKSVLAKTQKELMPKLRKLREDYEGIELTPRSAPHLRNPCSAKRRGRQDPIRYLGAYRRQLHPGHLHPRDQ